MPVNHDSQFHYLRMFSRELNTGEVLQPPSHQSFLELGIWELGMHWLMRQFTNTDPNSGEVLRGTHGLKGQKGIRSCQAAISAGREAPQTNPGLYLIAAHIYSLLPNVQIRNIQEKKAKIGAFAYAFTKSPVGDISSQSL